MTNTDRQALRDLDLWIAVNVTQWKCSWGCVDGVHHACQHCGSWSHHSVICDANGNYKMEKPCEHQPWYCSNPYDSIALVRHLLDQNAQVTIQKSAGVYYVMDVSIRQFVVQDAPTLEEAIGRFAAAWWKSQHHPVIRISKVSDPQSWSTPDPQPASPPSQPTDGFGPTQPGSPESGTTYAQPATTDGQSNPPPDTAA